MSWLKYVYPVLLFSYFFILNILPRIGVPSGGDNKSEDISSVQLWVNVSNS